MAKRRSIRLFVSGLLGWRRNTKRSYFSRLLREHLGMRTPDEFETACHYRVQNHWCNTRTGAARNPSAVS